jgi:3-methyladenine DNA glycosylase AlkD
MTLIQKSMSKITSINDIVPRGIATVPQLRVAAKTWVKANKDLSAIEAAKIVTLCMNDSSDLRKCMGGILLGYMQDQRSLLNPDLYDGWLEYATGWSSVDAICYNVFSASEMLNHWAAWTGAITELSKSENVFKRRGALVLLTKPVSVSNDQRLAELSFRVIDRLKGEKDILITKAISWLLRSLTKFHAAEVKEYLGRNVLPAVAVRETRNKLDYGRKNHRGT